MNATLPEASPTISEKLPFHWKYVCLPFIMMGAAIVLTAVFVPLLPEEAVFRLSDTAEERVMSRGALAALFLLPQIVFTLLSYGIVRLFLFNSQYWGEESPIITKVLVIAGNLTVIAQLVFILAEIYVFFYNKSGMPSLPFWVPVVIILAIGAGVIGVLFIRILMNLLHLRRTNNPGVKNV